MNATDLKNINTTSLEIYVEPADDWVSEYEGFDLSKLNFTWEVWRYRNQSILESIDKNRNISADLNNT